MSYKAENNVGRGLRMEDEECVGGCSDLEEVRWIWRGFNDYTSTRILKALKLIEGFLSEIERKKTNRRD